MTEPKGRGEAAILDPARAGEQLVVGRAAPPATLAPFVDYFWWVRWHAQPAYTSQVLPAPVVHLSAEWRDGAARLLVNGVQRHRFERRLEGRGHVVAAAFRPGCFRPLLGGPVSALTARTLPAEEVLGVDDRAPAARLLEPGVGEEEMVRVLGGWLEDLDPRPDPLAVELAALVTAAERDPALTRADRLADLAGVSLRTLQRQFSAYVGIGPKWVVQRCRLLDVAAAVHSGEPVDWAELAARLGFVDQSHLSRAFTAVIGRPPATYARAAGSGDDSP